MPLHPIIARHIRVWYRQKMDKVSQEPISVAREKLLPLLPVPEELPLNYQDYWVDNAFTIRLYTPLERPTAPAPLVIFIRASGFSIGSPDHYNLPCAQLSQLFGCWVAGIEHRLSPEHPFPTPLDDCERGVQWLIQNAPNLGVDPSKIALWGECSGANLSTALCHRLARKGPHPISSHTMLYPVLAQHKFTESKEAYGRGYMTDLDMLEFTLRQYLPCQSLRTHPEVSPLLFEDFDQLPPTQISVGAYDLFKDEAKLYRDKFAKTNPNIQFEEHPGLVHGFIQYYDLIEQVRTIIQKLVTNTKAQFDNSPQSTKALCL